MKGPLALQESLASQVANDAPQKSSKDNHIRGCAVLPITA